MHSILCVKTVHGFFGTLRQEHRQHIHRIIDRIFDRALLIGRRALQDVVVY
jgi:hypothetical protein